VGVGVAHCNVLELRCSNNLKTVRDTMLDSMKDL